jgi:SAM-dependent methyltransferase
MQEQIYSEPDHYDLEHSTEEEDVGFYLALVAAWRPVRTLELACGNGRISFPLARQLARAGGRLTGLDSSPEMLASARRKSEDSAEPADRQIEWLEGDMREWRSQVPFQLILCPCASMSHLLELGDQIAAWRSAWRNLAPGGRFLVAEQMANLPVLADSQASPARVVLELDSDTVRQNGGTPERLVRYRATRYFAHEQRASVRFLYDKLRHESEIETRFLSDYECHVFYPRELELLFRVSGFDVEHIWGDYQRGKLGPLSRQLIVVGRKPAADS